MLYVDSLDSHNPLRIQKDILMWLLSLHFSKHLSLFFFQKMRQKSVIRNFYGPAIWIQKNGFFTLFIFNRI